MTNKRLDSLRLEVLNIRKLGSLKRHNSVRLNGTTGKWNLGNNKIDLFVRILIYRADIYHCPFLFNEGYIVYSGQTLFL